MGFVLIWMICYKKMADSISLDLLGILWFPKTSSAAAKSLQLCPILCNPIDSSLPGFPVLGILQARTLEWVAISFSNAWKWKVKVKSLSRNPMDCSPPGSSTHGIFPGKSTGVGCHCLLRKTSSCNRKYPHPQFSNEEAETRKSWRALQHLK